MRTIPAIQRWRLLKAPPAELTSEVPHLEHLRQHVLGTPPEAWGTVYGQVAGVLPLDELRKNGQPVTVILQGELLVNQAGKLRFELSTTEKVQLWFDATAFDGQSQGEMALEPGLHQVTVRVEISDRADPGLKLEFHKPEDSAIQFEVIGGP